MSIRKENAMTALLTMSDGDIVLLNWSEEGGAEVRFVHDVWVLHEVPHYGGYPRYSGTYNSNNVQSLIDEAYSWT